MAQNITIANATYPSVPAIDVPKQGGGTARYSDASVTTATASDVKQGKIFVNAQGEQDAGTYATPTGNINITQAGVTDVTNYATATVPVAIGSAEMSDYYSTESSVRKYTVEADGLITDAGWVFLGYQQAFHGYKTYNAVPKNTTITPTTSAQTIGGANYMMEGAVTVAAMPSGSATPPTTISGSQATLTTGTNTITLQKTLSVTPQVSAGYVSAGTAGNTNVSLTANVTTKAAATITPGTTNQTIASGTYLTGTQTISGDANLVAGNIKNGTSIFGVTGTYEGSNPVKTKTGTFTGNGTRTIDVACDFEPDLVYVTSDPGTTASSGTVAFIIARDMMAASRYRNNSTTNSHYAVTPCVNLNTSGSSYSWRATYANSKVTLYSYSNSARALLTNGRTYTYQFVKWTT